VSSVALLDVNVLVALFDPDHLHHEAAHRWFAEQRRIGWATCPLTENGLLRVLTHPAYSQAAGPPADVLELLQAFCSSGGHAFWPDDVSLRDAELFQVAAPPIHRQVIDVYLLGLAVKHGGHLATFDRSIPLAKVRRAEAETLALIPA
jgi:toxin-antitoxin system PIN domain toxin